MPGVRAMLQQGLQRIRRALEQPQGYQSEVKMGRHVGIAESCVLIESTIGDYTYCGARTVIAHSVIGRFCSIASEVHIGSGSHPARTTVSTHPLFYLYRPKNGWDFIDNDKNKEFQRTIVGNDVWIGAKSFVRDGVIIGDGAIVGAGAVVVRDIEPYGIYGGVPARLIRYRFTEDIRTKLLAFRWWEKDDAWLRRHAHDFADIDLFKRVIDDA